MKSFRWTLLFLVVVGGLATFTFYDFKRAGEEGEAKDNQKSVLRLKPDEIQHFELITRLTTTSLDRRDGKWYLEAGTLKDRADDTTTNNFLLVLSSEKFAQKVTEKVGAEAGTTLATFGLDEPLTRLKIRGADGKTQEIKIGSVKAYDGSLYAMIEGETSVSLVGTNWDAYLSKKANDFRDKHLVRSDIEGAKRVVIRERGAVTELQLIDTKWKLVSGARLKDYPVSEERVKAYLDQLKVLRASEFLPALPQAKEKLEKTDFEIQIFKDKPEPIVTVWFSPVLPTLKIAPETKLPPAPEKVRARSSDLADLTEMPLVLAKGAKKSAQDFYDTKLPFRLGGGEAAITQIEMRLAGDEADLHPQVDASKLKDLVSKVSQLEAVKILEEPPGKTVFANRLRFQDAAKSVIFDLSWSPPASGLVIARSNLVAETFTVNEADLKALDLASLLKPSSVPSPSNVKSAAPPRPQ